MHDVPQAGLALPAVAGPVERRVRPRRRGRAHAAPKPNPQTPRICIGAAGAEREARCTLKFILAAKRCGMIKRARKELPLTTATGIEELDVRKRGQVSEASPLGRAVLRRCAIASMRGLTFELSWHRRCGALDSERKMGRRPCARRPARHAVGAQLERGVRQRRAGFWY